MAAVLGVRESKAAQIELRDIPKPST